MGTISCDQKIENLRLDPGPPLPYPLIVKLLLSAVFPTFHLGFYMFFFSLWRHGAMIFGYFRDKKVFLLFHLIHSRPKPLISSLQKWLTHSFIGYITPEMIGMKKECDLYHFIMWLFFLKSKWTKLNLSASSVALFQSHYLINLEHTKPLFPGNSQ